MDDDESLRELLVGSGYEAVADRPFDLDRTATATAIDYAAAVDLIADGWADEVTADLDGVEQHVEQWASGRD